MSRTLLVLAIVLSIPLSSVCAKTWPAADRAQFADALAATAYAYRPPAHLAPAAALPSGPGVVYSQPQMEQALDAEGLSAPSAHVGGAIGEAESHGRSDAVCDSCAGVRELSVGPWQLNLLAHPWISRACAMALGCAAAAVAQISGGGRDWTPWSTYTNNAWRAYA